MNVDSQIVAELRSMFLNGATPARLIRHIAHRHEGDAKWPAYAEPYFAEAFKVTTFVMDNDPPQVDLDEIDWSELDVEILRDMVGRRAAWRESVGSGEESAWFDGLSVSSDDLKMNDQIQPESHPALSESWGAMTPRAREFVRQCMVNAQGYYERMQVLARLVERLQRQIVELEEQNQHV